MSPNQNYIYLHKVDGIANNNKFYEMKNNGDGTFTATYGREGATKPAIKQYSLNLWESKYNEKISSRKGYTDVTHLRSVVVATGNSSNVKSKGEIISKDPEVCSFIELLQSYSKTATNNSYKVQAKSVTQAQIDEAQRRIDNLSRSLQYFGRDFDIDMFNIQLTKLMIVIPRKMVRVADHLITSSFTKSDIEELIRNEQNLLDSMSSQVTTNTVSNATDDSTVDDSQLTLLEKLGLEVRPATKSETQMAIKMSQEHGHRVKRVFAIVNKKTQEAFDNALKVAKNKKTGLYWHGTLRENLMSIVQQGLRIRPSNAVYTGSMYGNGIYFATEADKSMGYTDGGRWTGGRKDTNCVYMAINEVLIGNPKIVNKHTSDCYGFNKKTLQPQGYDSVWAKKGVSLFRDEIIVYSPEQVTIKYLVEFK